MDQQFITLYIEKMSKRLEDFMKNEILLQTQLELTQKINESLNTELEKLKLQIESFLNSPVQTEEKPKRKREVNTSDSF